MEGRIPIIVSGRSDTNYTGILRCNGSINFFRRTRNSSLNLERIGKCFWFFAPARSSISVHSRMSQGAGTVVRTACRDLGTHSTFWTWKSSTFYLL